MGLDVLGPGSIRRLPDIARVQLLQLMHYCERERAWPRQCSIARRVTAGKPRGGGRVLGLIACVPKLWGKCLAAPSESWPLGLADHWGTAIRGSSALRPGLLRACLA
eukprot:8775176-Pyramimonas_sp.AAC.1